MLRLYKATVTAEWRWFEDILSHCNAKLPYALLVSGHALERDDVIEASLDALVWLAEIHSPAEGHFAPIGCDGFYRPGPGGVNRNQGAESTLAFLLSSVAVRRRRRCAVIRAEQSLNSGEVNGRRQCLSEG